MPSESNLQLAIRALSSSGRDMCVPNVFRAYALFAGHQSCLSTPEGKKMVEQSFERALEKHAPVQPLSVSAYENGVMTDNLDSVLWAIRHQYWYNKLGEGPWDGKGGLRFCENCGGIEVVKDGALAESHGHVSDEGSRTSSSADEDGGRVVVKRRTPKKNKKVKKNTRSSGIGGSKSTNAKRWDMNAPGPSSL